MKDYYERLQEKVNTSIDEGSQFVVLSLKDAIKILGDYITIEEAYTNLSSVFDYTEK